jgi:hypothetical protein
MRSSASPRVFTRASGRALASEEVALALGVVANQSGPDRRTGGRDVGAL